MAKSRIAWKENQIVNLKLRDDLYTIAQMLRSPYMRFFKTSNTTGQWSNLDLNEVDVLFTVSVGNVVLQQLVDRKITDKSVEPSQRPFEKPWIKPHLVAGGGYPFKGGKLIELDPSVGTTEAKVLKADLSVEEDRDVIEKAELTNMWGADDLGERLRHFFDTGKDRNLLKEKVFDLL